MGKGDPNAESWKDRPANQVLGDVFGSKGLGGALGDVGNWLGGGDDDKPFVRNTPPMPGQRRGGLQANGPVVGTATPSRTASGISSWGLGSFTSPSGAANTAPRTPRRNGNTATQPTGARSTNNATPRVTGIGPGGSTFDPEAVGMANSVRNASGGSTQRVRPGETLPVTAHNLALQRPGARALPGGNVQTRNASGGTTTRVFNPGALNRPNASGNQVIRTQTQQRNLPVTANNQRIADTKAYAQTPESKVTDPNNWAGIARDLGNAGAKPWAAHATGALPSTNAMAYVRANPTMATPAATRRANVNAPGATSATASAGAGLAAARPRMSTAQSIAKRRENAAPYKASLQRRTDASGGGARPVVRNEAQRRALPVTPHNQARRRAAAGGRNQPV